jgi:YHS domain-containing protein
MQKITPGALGPGAMTCQAVSWETPKKKHPGGKKKAAYGIQQAGRAARSAAARKVGMTKRMKGVNSMNKTLYSIVSLGLFGAPALSGELVNVAGASGIALDGYDPVAFFIEKKSTHGDPAISATYKGATYFFASKEHKAKFEADPEKYVPQYGGYCAFGVALGALFPVDINTWQVRNKKLYLNLNPVILEKFNKDFEGQVAKAEKNWPDLVKKNSK